jgi:hypothetical protein
MRYLEDLKFEELKKVYHANSKLREEVFNEYLETIETIWVEDYLYNFKDCVNYELSYGSHNYFTVREGKELDFIKALEDTQKDYCFLSDSYNEDIEIVKRMISIDQDFDLDYKYNSFRIVIDSLIGELEKACLNRLLSEYEPLENEDDLITYFLEYWWLYVADFKKEAYYVNEDYVLFEKVIKCYK